MPLRPMMMPRVGKSGPLMYCIRSDRVRFGIVQHADARADHLAQVVGRDVGSHTHGDTGRAVHQQVGKTAGEHAGLLAALVEVGVPVHRVLFNVAEHLVGDLRQTRLGVTVGSGGVAIHTSRSCRGRPPAYSAWRSPAPDAPARRKRRRRRGDGSGPARRPRRWRIF